MTVSFNLPVKPFSINRMSTRDARFKTAEYKLWATEVLARLQDLDEYKQLLDLAAAHEKHGGFFFVQFSYNYPAYVFLNKQGQISAKTIDCSNGAKPLLDLIFGDTMQTNDRYVTVLKEQKRIGASHSIDVIITLL